MSSILNDVKHSLGFLPADTAYDSDVIMHINSAISTLTQLGVGPVAGFEITGESDEWDDFVSDPRMNSVKSYIFLKVTLLMNPPSTGFVTNAYERQLQELEFRLNVVADYG